MNLLKIIYLILFFSTGFINSHAQNFELYGDIKPGSLVIGKGTNISKVMLGKKNVQVDNNGIFAFGFDRNAVGTRILVVTFTNNKSKTKKIVLPHRKYEIQKLRISNKYIVPPHDALVKIEKEADLMKAARAEVGKMDTALFSTGFVYPVNDPRITSVFGSQRILNGIRKKPHNGIDFGADEGTPVYSASDGNILIAGDNFYYNGNFVLIDHGQGLTSVYLHMSKLSVKTGDRVKKGQKIGEVGSTGRSTSAHLHWGVQWFGYRIDPLSLFQIDIKQN